MSFSTASISAAAPLVPYLSAPASQPSSAFNRPEGSFAVRAFGNVVHRFLQLCALRLEAGATPEELAAALPQWASRVSAALRAEGIAPASAPRLAERALHALTAAMADPVGRWILSPHPGATSEGAIRLLAEDAPLAREIRADRTFRAGATPGSKGETHLWIVDFKTTEQGSRTDAAFAAAERDKYSGQLAAYARTFRSLPDTPDNMVVGLYYPLVPKLLCWQAETATPAA